MKEKKVKYTIRLTPDVLDWARDEGIAKKIRAVLEAAMENEPRNIVVDTMNQTKVSSSITLLTEVEKLLSEAWKMPEAASALTHVKKALKVLKAE